MKTRKVTIPFQLRDKHAWWQSNTFTYNYVHKYLYL